MPDPTERLIASTRRKLGWLTLGLLATLLVAMGAATLLVLLALKPLVFKGKGKDWRQEVGLDEAGTE